MRYRLPLPDERVTPEYVLLLDRVERRAAALDSKFRIPLTRVRFGWDPIAGLIPIIGDLVMAAVALQLVRDARKLGASNWLVARMSANVLIDAACGAVPLVGVLFDLFFRANTRNLKLLIDAIEDSRRRRSGGGE